MYDPLDLTKITEHLVVKDDQKKYYRFRPARFYGGIATADTVGCNLRCKFCWSTNSVWKAKSTGEFYSPYQVAQKLIHLAQKKNFVQMRVSGGEPTLGKNHLLQVLDHIPKRYGFILETNGILLGVDQSYVKELAQFSNVHVRVCLKGCNEQEFSFLTGAENGFFYQLQALEFLRDEQMNFNIALVSLLNEKQQLLFQLEKRGLDHMMIEKEEIVLYPQVRKRLQKEGLLRYFQ
jgi:uncharacterized Fe-S cluster-containing radical SAM superfamily protein